MTTCKLCEKQPPRPNGICDSCMTVLGIIEMPPARRRAGPCAKCEGLRFVRVIPREYTVEDGRDRTYTEIAPMCLTMRPVTERKLLGKGNNVEAATIRQAKGMLDTYTCLGCGYVEWYVVDPMKIPIGPEYMSELIDHTPDAPYR